MATRRSIKRVDTSPHGSLQTRKDSQKNEQKNSNQQKDAEKNDEKNDEKKAKEKSDQDHKKAPSPHSSNRALITAVQYCLLSVFFSALGAAAAKYNMQYAEFGTFLQDQCANFLVSSPEILTPASKSPLSTPPPTITMLQSLGESVPMLLPACVSVVGIIVKIIQFGMTMGLNTLGLSYSLRASHNIPSSVVVALCNGLAFIMNAVLGIILFKEEIKVSFLYGLMFILLGLYLVCDDQAKQQQFLESDGHDDDKNDAKDGIDGDENDDTSLKKESKKDKNDTSSKKESKKEGKIMKKNPTEKIDQDQEEKSPQFQEKGNWFMNMLWQIHLIFEPLEERPFETFVLGILVGICAITIALFWIMFSPFN